MKILVIADVHLRFEDDREKKIIEFFDKIAFDYKKIIILGDFFEFWFGFRDVIISDYFNILKKLKELTDSGIEIVFIEGNHDFNMGDFFTDSLKISVFDEYYSCVLNSKKFLFIHGDTINLSEDKFYAILRRFLRSRFVKFLMNLLPTHVVLRIAKRFSSTSRKYLYKDFNLEMVIDNFRELEHYDYILSGHFHRNFNYKNFYILADWDSEFNYIEIGENGEVEYKIF